MRALRWRVAAAIGGMLVLTAGSAPAGAVEVVPQPPAGQQLRSAAHCAASNGTSVYDYKSEAVITMFPAGPKLTSVRWIYKGVDPKEPGNIPNPAKNNVTIKLVKADGSVTYNSWKSADNQNYFDGRQNTIYSLEPHWVVPSGAGDLTRVRSDAVFDKRGVEDARCRAETPPFQGAAGVSP